MGNMDTPTVIKMVFGAGAFEDWFGDVTLLPLVKEFSRRQEEDAHKSKRIDSNSGKKVGSKGNAEADMEDFERDMERKKKLMEAETAYCEELARKLMARLEGFPKDPAKSIDEWEDLAIELCELPGGGRLLGMLGTVYTLEGKQFAGRYFGAEGLVSYVQETTQIMGSVVSLAWKFQRVASMAEKLKGKDGSAIASDETLDEEEKVLLLARSHYQST